MVKVKPFRKQIEMVLDNNTTDYSPLPTSPSSLQILERAEKPGDLERVKHEVDILYEFSTRLLKSTTPEEVLDAISIYAHENGATSGHLFYVDEMDNNWIEMVAQWSLVDSQSFPTGWRVQVPDRTLRQDWLSDPEQPTLIPDITTSRRVNQKTRKWLQQYNVRGFVALPLNNKARWIGVIYFLWNYPYTFNASDERIFAALQRQTSPVVDSIRLLDQTLRRTSELEEVNHELNLLYRASEVINKANTYEEVVEAVSYFDPEADVVTLMLWENFDWEIASYLEVVVVVDRNGHNKIQPGSRLPREGFPIAKHMLGERVWLFEDALTDPRIDPITAESWARLDIRSFMGPALYIGNRWIGGITFHSSQPRHYSQREVRLFAGIGDLVVAAVERIRLQQETETSRQHAESLAHTISELLEQTQRRATELESANTEIDLLYHIGGVINAANSYSELINAVSGIISGDITIGLYFWENWDFETASYVEVIAGTEQIAARIGQQVSKQALAYTQNNLQERLVVIEDVTTDPRLDVTTIASYLDRELRAVISIRLYVKEHWIGALAFQSKQSRAFSNRERRLVSGVGHYVQGAIQRIQFQHETEAARHAAERFAEQAQQLAALEERNRLARELHDSVSQVLYSISLWGHSARAFLEHDPSRIGESVDYILSLAEVGISEMRTLIFELRPESLDEVGLISALRKQADSLQARHAIQINTNFCSEPEVELQVKSDLYRIAREALHNIIKHAQATYITISLLESPAKYRLEICDNGIGFDTSQSFPGHLGLKSMQERTETLGGTIQIKSTVGVGTRISLTLPR
jgi:signal transduction histidine kinase